MALALHHVLEGPPAAPTVVLSPGLGTDLGMWEPEATMLAERFRVLRYDLRGHGGSPVPEGPYTIAELGGDILALMDQLGLERASLCGVSLGGMASMWVAAQAPARVERLVVCCSAARPKHPRSYAERAATVRDRGIDAVADTVLARWFTRELPRTQPELVSAMKQTLLATSPEGYAGCCEALAGTDLRADLGAIAAPTLVISGSEDRAMPPECGRGLSRGISRARLVVIPAAAHLASVERPDSVGELMTQHLSEEEPLP